MGILRPNRRAKRPFRRKNPTGERQLFSQLRTFAGRRTSDDARFADSQWGGGLGLTAKFTRNIRAFLEPSARWSRHHLADPAATKLFDRETVVRAELAADLNFYHNRYQLLGWEIALGYSWIKSDTATNVGSYTRRLLGLQLNKSY